MAFANVQRKLIPFDIGHQVVQDDGVNRLLVEKGECFEFGGEGEDAVAVEFEERNANIERGGVVVHTKKSARRVRGTHAWYDAREAGANRAAYDSLRRVSLIYTLDVPPR